MSKNPLVIRHCTGSLSVGFLNDVDYPTAELGDENADRRRSRPTRERHSHPTTVRAGEQG